MAEKSYLEMSDEELLAGGPPEAAASTEVVTDTPAPEAEATDAAPAKSGDGGEVKDTQDTDATEDAADKETSGEQEDQDPEDSKDEPAKPATPEAKPAEAAEPDYKAEYLRLLAPFKANGKEIAVSTVDDAISLMQMGANYNKKMAGLKPSLKMMKLLENSGLLSEEKISYLIDLEKKNPAAINKLIKDSGIDPMDLDAEKANGYTPQTYTVDDREMELDSVLDSIQETPSYNRTLAIVSSEWDVASKQVIAASPQLLKVINDHVASGIYDTIHKEVERGRMLGRLKGLSDIDAYRQVGDAIQARGGFTPVVQGSALSPEKPALPPVSVPPKPSQAEEDKLREKRRAAGSTKPAGSAGVAKEFNPLAMSDEEFSKSTQHKYF